MTFFLFFFFGRLSVPRPSRRSPKPARRRLAPGANCTPKRAKRQYLREVRKRKSGVRVWTSGQNALLLLLPKHAKNGAAKRIASGNTSGKMIDAPRVARIRLVPLTK